MATTSQCEPKCTTAPTPKTIELNSRLMKANDYNIELLSSITMKISALLAISPPENFKPYPSEEVPMGILGEIETSIVNTEKMGAMLRELNDHLARIV